MHVLISYLQKIRSRIRNTADSKVQLETLIKSVNNKGLLEFEQLTLDSAEFIVDSRHLYLSINLLNVFSYLLKLCMMRTNLMILCNC